MYDSLMVLMTTSANSECRTGQRRTGVPGPLIEGRTVSSLRLESVGFFLPIQEIQLEIFVYDVCGRRKSAGISGDSTCPVFHDDVALQLPLATRTTSLFSNNKRNSLP